MHSVANSHSYLPLPCRQAFTGVGQHHNEVEGILPEVSVSCRHQAQRFFRTACRSPFETGGERPSRSSTPPPRPSFRSAPTLERRTSTRPSRPPARGEQSSSLTSPGRTHQQFRRSLPAALALCIIIGGSWQICCVAPYCACHKIGHVACGVFSML